MQAPEGQIRLAVILAEVYFPPWPGGVAMRFFLAYLIPLLSLFATVPPAHAADSFGAIAYSPATQAVGWSYSYSTRSGAEQKALSGCTPHARDCRIAIWFKNACGAVAVGANGWGSGWAATSTGAKNKAVHVCSRHTRNCQVYRWQCSGAN